jgi:hypothetical protein
MMRMRNRYNSHLIQSSLIIGLIIVLLLNTVGNSLSNNIETNSEVEETYLIKDSAEPVNSGSSRGAINNGPFCDVVVCPNPIIINSVGKIWINFTFEEYNGYDLTLKSNSFRFLTVKGEHINSSWSSLFSELSVPAGANNTWPYNYQVKSDLLLSLKQYGAYRLFLNASFFGSDENNNELEVNIKVPVLLELTVAVIVEKSIYPSLKSKLQRYYNDVNELTQVDFIERNGTWSTPETLRSYIKSLWQSHNISGAILVGYVPVPMWEFTRSQSDSEKCPIPIFYEDLDGSFADVDADTYYDRHYWGPNDGPEIWVSFIMPPIRGQTIPSSHLDPSGLGVGGGLTGYYYEDNSLTTYNGSRIDSVIDFDWEDEALYNNIYPDNFSIRWTGKLKVDNNETYSFYTEAKGGVRVWIDGNIVINRAFDFTNHMYQNFGGKYLTKGWHDIKVEYYENGKGPDEHGMLRLSWSSTKLKIEPFKEYFDKTHLYYTDKLDQPDNALLFMDYCYGVKCKMEKPIKYRLLDPIYNNQIVVGGCQNNTNASEYLELLKSGYELISVWSHAGSTYHHIKPLNDSNARTSAQYWKIRRRPAGLVTFIWGCHGGDIMAGGDFEKGISNNLVSNYAFNSGYGLAAAGCTRSYGTTFRETYYALQNESYLGLGYYLFKDYSYNKTLRIQTVPDIGKDKWIDDEILMGDPFIGLNHRPTDLKLSMENDRKWINYTDVTLSISCLNSEESTNEMSFRSGDGIWTSWETYSSTRSWQLSSGAGSKRLEIRMRNSYGSCFNNAYDVIGIDTEPPTFISMIMNDGNEVTKNRTVKFELDVVDDLSGPHRISFSLDGTSWSKNIEFSPVVYWDLTGKSGIKTIYVKVLDGAGNQGQIMIEEIRLETAEIHTKAKVTGELGENGWYIGPISMELRFEVESPIADRIMYRLSEGEWIQYSSSFELDKSGYYNVEYYGMDIYGFKEDVNNITLKIDLESPTGLSVEIDNGNVITNKTEVNLEIRAADEMSGCWLMRLSEDSKSWGEWVNYSSFIQYTFTEENFEGFRTIYIQVKDRAGNIIENPVMDDIYVDHIHPIIVSVTPVVDARNVSIETNITIVFSEKIKPELMNDRNIYLIDSERSFIHGALDYRSDSFILVFTPERSLDHYTTYSLIIEPNLKDMAGNSLQESGIYNFTTIGQVPGSVVDLEAKLADNEIYVSWEPPLYPGSGPVLGYKLYRSTSSTAMEFIIELSPKERYYIDTLLEGNSTYSYTVSAFNQIGNGPVCEPVSVYVPVKESDMNLDVDDKKKLDPNGEKLDNINKDDENKNKAIDDPDRKRTDTNNSGTNILSLSIGIIISIVVIIITLFIFTKKKRGKSMRNTKIIENQEQVLNTAFNTTKNTAASTIQIKHFEYPGNQGHQVHQIHQGQQGTLEQLELLEQPGQFGKFNQQEQQEQNKQPMNQAADEELSEYQKYRQARGL